MSEIVIPSYLFKNISDISTIKQDLYDLCCDEYYRYFDIIDDKIIFIMKYDLLISCGYSGSIDAFEYLKNRFKINISNNLLIDDKDNYILKKILKYNLKTEFYRYIIQNYELNIIDLLEIFPKIYFNKDIDFIIELHNKIDHYISIHGLEHIENEYNKNITLQFSNSLIHNQIYIILFLICKVKNKIFLNSETFKNILNNKFSYYENIYNLNDFNNTLDIIILYFNNFINSNTFNNAKYLIYNKNIYSHLQNYGIYFEQKILINHLYYLKNVAVRRNKISKKIINSIINTICWIYCNIVNKNDINHKLLLIDNFKLNNINQCIIDNNPNINLDYSKTIYYEYYIYKKVCENRKKYIEFYNKIYLKKKYNYNMITL